MYLVDSSVWINHLRQSDSVLVEALSNDLVATHTFVIGELTLGSLKDGRMFIRMLQNLPTAKLADHDEVLKMIEVRQLYSRGLGWVDAHLLASALISEGYRLWTADKRLHDVAIDLGAAEGGAH